MPYIEVSTIVQANKFECYEIAKNMEAYPKFMENVNDVKIIDRGENFTITSWDTNVDGRAFKWKEKDMLDEVTPKIQYYQISGDLKKFQGEWRFDEENNQTKVTLTVDFELGIPMLATLLNPILKKKVRINSEAMLQAIKQRLEH